jgi:Dyp-type peroxidase family
MARGAGDVATAVRLSAIQGNVAPGFRRDHQAFVLVRFRDRQAGRRWLGALRPDVASAEDVAAGQPLSRRPEPDPGDRAPRIDRPAWVNLALSWDGLRALGADGLDAFPAEFRGSRFQWSAGGAGRPAPADEEVHALLIVAADRADELERELARQRARLDACAVRELTTYHGQTLPGPLRGHEHFGFRDGIGQPRIEGIASEGARSGRCTRTGEFILGYPNELGELGSEGPPWSRDGSYLVFWRLRQHVAAFRQGTRREAARLGLSPEQLAAKLVGRWPSGALPSDPIQPCDPGLPEGARPDPSTADFGDDPHGRRFPLIAHIRKAHPRDQAGALEHHRLLRRGIPYGQPLPAGRLTDDGHDRGLLFLAYQASIARQFEHVQRHWIENCDFPARGVGPDALVGRSARGCPVSLPHEDGSRESVELRLPSFVTPTTRGYFFAPSLDAIDELACPASHRSLLLGEDSMLQARDTDELIKALRQLIETMVKEQVSEATHSSGNGAWPDAPEPSISQTGPGQIDPASYVDKVSGFDYARFLLEQNPYGVESVEPTDSIEVVGPARRNGIGYPLDKPLQDFTPLEVDECPRWCFDKENYRITKAIRIPYRYKHPRRDEDVEGSILIGFQGPGY